jgi:RimJ/RimL family protein N-acetyltransferase
MTKRGKRLGAVFKYQIGSGDFLKQNDEIGLKAGEIYKQFSAKNKTVKVVLRSLRWEDLDMLVEFVNNLVEEHETNPEFGMLLDKRQTREDEAEWLSNRLVAIEKGKVISVVADVDGKIIGHGDVIRGEFADTHHHGTLAIGMAKEYRNLGIGTEIMKTLIEESRKAELKTIELEVFNFNERAGHVYEKVGFKDVGIMPKRVFRNGRFIDSRIMEIVL